MVIGICCLSYLRQLKIKNWCYTELVEGRRAEAFALQMLRQAQHDIALLNKHKMGVTLSLSKCGA